MTNQPPVLLLGSDCLTGLQTARILWRRGVSVVGLADDPRSPYCRTRAVDRTLATSIDDPVALLRELRGSGSLRPVVLACTDATAWWLNANRDVVSEHAQLLLPPPQALELLVDKARFYRFAMGHGLPIPRTRFVREPNELSRAAAELSFPLVLKPPRRSQAWLAASDGVPVLRVEDRSTLMRIGPGLVSAAGELILQSWIRGPEGNGRELSLCLDARGELLASIVLRKLRQWPLHTGTSSLAVELEDPEVSSRGLELLHKLGYAGAGQLEFKRDAEDGRLYLIEVNAGRTALNFPLAEACGLDLTYTWYCAAAGLPLPPNRMLRRPGGKWICWKRDLPAALTHWRQGDLTLRDWVRSVRGHKWSADISADDPLPLLADVARKARAALRRRTQPARP